VSKNFIESISAKDGMVVVKTSEGLKDLTPRQARERFDGTAPMVDRKDTRGTNILADFKAAIKQAEEQRK